MMCAKQPFDPCHPFLLRQPSLAQTYLSRRRPSFATSHGTAFTKKLITVTTGAHPGKYGRKREKNRDITKRRGYHKKSGPCSVYGGEKKNKEKKRKEIEKSEIKKNDDIYRQGNGM